jgi:hypothetical protein
LIRNADMVVGSVDGKEINRPDWHKVFIMAGTDQKIIQHECLYEGRAGYQLLYDHVIFAQITVKGEKNPGDTYKEIENTPTGTFINSLQPRESLLKSNKLWRYLNLYKFEDLISSKTLYFSRLDQFIDKLEGISPFSCINAIKEDKEKNDEQKSEALRLYNIRMERNREISFACCWHINDALNLGMWENYGQQSNESICIQTSVSKLNKSLSKSKLPFLAEPVQYFDEPYFNQNAYWFPTLFKRSEFRQEQEYRTIFFIHGYNLNGLRIHVNPEELITKIFIHPNASSDFFKKIRLFLKANHLKIPIAKAKLKT